MFWIHCALEQNIWEALYESAYKALTDKWQQILGFSLAMQSLHSFSGKSRGKIGLSNQTFLQVNNGNVYKWIMMKNKTTSSWEPSCRILRTLKLYQIRHFFISMMKCLNITNDPAVIVNPKNFFFHYCIQPQYAALETWNFKRSAALFFNHLVKMRHLTAAYYRYHLLLSSVIYVLKQTYFPHYTVSTNVVSTIFIVWMGERELCINWVL